MYTLPHSLHDHVRTAALRVMEGGRHLTDEIAWILREVDANEIRAKAVRDHLYRMVRSGDLDPAVDVEATSLHMPEWLRLRCERSLGERLQTFLDASAVDAPVFLRVNTLKATMEQCIETLAPFDVIQISEETLRADRPYGLFRSDAFAAGWFEQQDITSQRVVRSMNVIPGQRVYDACAGVGGKALHIAALMQNKGRIVALDVVESKLLELKRRARRAGATIIEPRHITSTKTVKRLADSADRVLIDVPCSGTGVLRRNPDITWHLTEDQLDELVQQQADILRRNARTCKPGGTVVYATCSVLREEGVDQIDRFIAENSEFTVTNSWSTLPGEDGGDGFYVAVLTRSTPS